MNPLTYRLSTAAMLALSLAGCGGRISDSLEIQQRDESATFRATGDLLVVEEPDLFLREGVLLKQTESVVSAIAEVTAGSPKFNGSSLEGEGERANAPDLVGCAAGSWLTQSNQCEPCFPGTWDHDEDVLTACENHSACAAG